MQHGESEACRLEVREGLGVERMLRSLCIGLGAVMHPPLGIATMVQIAAMVMLWSVRLWDRNSGN